MSDLILKSINRTPFNWLELDMPKCLLDYGNGLCNAALGVTGDQKCYKTRATCQSTDVFDATDNITTYSFCENRGYIPDDRYYFPYLESVNVSPASLNFGGGNKNKSALGTMATLSATFADHPHTDRIADPYLISRDFDPYERSTFWAKWRARNPYYMHREVRYYSGFIDLDTGYVDPATLIKRTFFVTGFGGFSAGGNVSLKAADIMTFIANDKAKAPKASLGKISSDMNSGVGSLSLTPVGIGDLDYPAAGKIRINKEVMSFTRTGDSMSLTRGIANTDAQEHKTGDTVQLCLEFISQKPSDILFDIETIYAEIPEKYLDTVQWNQETTDHLPRLYSTLITEPTGVRALISEMAEQMYFTTVWDERTALQYMRAVRPSAGETIINLDDDRNLLEDSVTWNDEAGQLITDVWVYYGQKNPVIKLDEGSNYSALDVISDTDSKGVNRNNTERIKVIHSRWINEGGAAIDLGDKTLARYNEIPRSCSFSLDAKDGNLWLSDFITMQNRHVVDASGLSVPVAMQVMSAQESVQGTTYTYIAQQYSGNVIEDVDGEINLAISNDMVNLNLREYYDANIGTTPESGDKIRFTIRSGVTIGGCAFTDVENISDSASTATDSSTSISDLFDLSTFNAEYEFYTQFNPSKIFNIRNAVNLKGVSASIVSAVQFSAGDNFASANAGFDYSFTTDMDLDIHPKRHSMDSGLWPAGVDISVIIEIGANILGQGGPAMPVTGNSITYIPSLPDYAGLYGGDGGDAIKASYPMNINNSGLIAGGGASGYSYIAPVGIVDIGKFYQSGGGGAGYYLGNVFNNGNALAGASVRSDLSALNNTPITISTVESASRGSNDAAGFGGKTNITPQFASLEPVSYSGGGLGEQGYASDGARVGIAGSAVSAGSSLITWINRGTIIGAEID